MYRWFRTGDIGIVSGQLVIKEPKQEQQKLAGWVAKHLRPKKEKPPEPQDPSLRKGGSTVWKSETEEITGEVKAGTSSEVEGEVGSRKKRRKDGRK